MREADLSRAVLSKADLTDCTLRKAYLSYAHLDGAHLINANLNRATLVNTNLAGAHIKNCIVYGISAWKLNIDSKTEQRNLILEDSTLTGDDLVEAITRTEGHYPLMVDDIEIAQFIHFVTNYRNFGKALNALVDKGILLLGNFRPDGKRLLELIAGKLRTIQKLPIIFDFERPHGSNFIETVTTLAGIAKIVVANLDSKSVPAELERITSNYSKPVIACVRAGYEKQVYSMFKDLLAKDNVLYVRYRSSSELLTQLEDQIRRAESLFHQLQVHQHESLLRKLAIGARSGDA